MLTPHNITVHVGPIFPVFFSFLFACGRLIFLHVLI
jgi:hypothetical protein